MWYGFTLDSGGGNIERIHKIDQTFEWMVDSQMWVCEIHVHVWTSHATLWFCVHVIYTNHSFLAKIEPTMLVWWLHDMVCKLAQHVSPMQKDDCNFGYKYIVHCCLQK